jgi:two-component system, NtrC family, sensor histidine kinase KinB
MTNYIARLGQWLLLFGGLLLAIWATTQLPEAPQLILLLLLYVVTINFSLPSSQGLVGLVPVVAVSSLLILGLETAVLLALISHTTAELARPLWQPTWDTINIARPSWRLRLGTIAVYLAALLTAGFAYTQAGGQTPLPPAAETDLPVLMVLAVSYGLVYLLLGSVLWLSSKRPFGDFLTEQSLSLLVAGLLAQPFAILGAFIFAEVGLPLFVLFAAGVMGVSLLIWLSWQRRYTAEQQLAQMAALNDSTSSLRETLELDDVLHRLGQQVASLVSSDQFTIYLLDGAGDEDKLRQTSYADPRGTPSTQPIHRTELDDFTRWVLREGRVLDVDGRNIHFAQRHQLTPPQPQPTAWLGLPLTRTNQITGVMVLQRIGNRQPFSRWSREVLQTVAAQASAAIENARLHSETVRLYNLTDEALARRVEQLQALLKTVQEGVLMLDVNGRILLINPVATKLLPAVTHSLTADSVPALGYDWPTFQERLAALRQGHNPPSGRVIYQLTGENGRSLRYLERTEAAVRSDDGQLMGWLILLRDVTEEQALAERRTDLIRMIVHDLRNPLTTFLSTLSVLEGEIDGLAAAEEMVQEARRGCYDMLDMVDSLMDINRMEAGHSMVEAEAMRLPLLVEQVVERLQPLAQARQVSLTYQSASDLPAVWADAEIVRRIVINLLDNGLKFTPPGGSVTITLKADSPGIEGYEPGIRCTVTDTGPGIPQAYQDRIFDRYLHTNPGGAQVQGTGLGLTFCKLAVEGHNGRIWAENGENGGSRFSFTLPGIPIWT